MSNRLDKLGLSEDLSLKYYVRQEDFIRELKKNVDIEYGNRFGDISYAFGINKTAYRGKVNEDSFLLRKKKSFFDSVSSIAVISGQITDEKNGTRVNVTICSFTMMVKLMGICLIAFYAIAAIYLPYSELIQKFGYMPFVFILGHALIMFLIFYAILRRSVSKISENLDRDFKIMIQYLPELDPKQS